MSRVYKMAWSGVRMFLKLTSQRCQLISLGSKTEVPGGPGPGIFESDVLASKSNASHMENLFTKWIEDNNAIHESWQRFFKDLVGDTAMTTPLQYDPNPNPNSIQSFNKHLGNGFNISSPSERVATSPEKLKQTKKNGTKTGDPHSDKIGSGSPVARHSNYISKGSSVPVMRTNLPPALENLSNTSQPTSDQNDLNTCVTCPQKSDINLLSHSPEIRTSGLYDQNAPSSSKTGFNKYGNCLPNTRIPGSVLTNKLEVNEFFKKPFRSISQIKEPNEPEKLLISAGNLTRSRRMGNSRNNFKTKYGSFNKFMKCWGIKPEIYIRPRSKANSKKKTIVNFKSYYEKSLKQGKGKVGNSTKKSTNKIPLDSKEEKSKQEPSQLTKCNLDKDEKDNTKLKATERPSKTFKDLTDNMDSEKTKEGSNESKPNQKPAVYKATVRIFIPQPKENPKADNKPKSSAKSESTNSKKPVPEKFKSLRVSSAEKNDLKKLVYNNLEKSLIYADELTLKSLIKPTPDS